MARFAIMAMLTLPSGLTLRAADDLDALNGQAVQLYRQGKYHEATAIAEKALEVAQRTLGAAHPDTLKSVHNLAALYRVQGRYAEAEPLYRRALAGREVALGAAHPDTLTTVNNIGFLYQAQGRYAEAEPLYRQALAGREAALGAAHPDTLTSVSNLGFLYKVQGRYAEAEPLYRRALAGREAALGVAHPETLSTVNNLGELYRAQRRYEVAEPLYRRALAGCEATLGAAHPSTLVSVNNLALLFQAQGRYAEAEPLYERVLIGQEAALGPAHPLTLKSANNLGWLYQAQGRYAEAEPLYRRALAGAEAVLGAGHPDTLRSARNLAALHFAQADWQGAAELLRRSTAAIVRRVQLGALDPDLTGKKKSESEQFNGHFRGLVKATFRLVPEGRAPDVSSASDMFQIAQWALNSEAAQALAQMAVRGAKDDPALRGLVRERQDLVAEWQQREQIQAASLGEDVQERDATVEAENRERMGAIDRRVAEIDQRLKTEFPDYAALATPAPLSVAEVQAQLGADEALVLFLNTPGSKPTPAETFIWVVTKTQMRWVRADLSKTVLAKEVQALRCGLDRAMWEGRSRCAQLTGQSRADELLAFDHARAHRLYKALLGQVEDLIKDKHLLIVPSGTLTQLPFAVLVSAPPAEGKSPAWLIRDHAITVLPAVSSLKALRAINHASAATQPLIGFGNPLLDGPDSSYAPVAKLAREKQRCPATRQDVAELGSFRAGMSPIETRGGLANVSDIRKAQPLPETADELCEVARDISGGLDTIHLGNRATEGEIKALSERGELARYRVVHFATHGAMAGELDRGSEPGLILTPPDKASEIDDGYLSASEIAGLKLDADLVILSACNTAAGEAPNAEALSGLARAFIYAQARTLLVSHWAVDSSATVKLITASMREVGRGNRIGRAEALRRAMLTLIDSGDPREQHPAYWAPFIIVGEGSR